MGELVSRSISASDPSLVAALRDGHLPTDDIEAPGRHFFAFLDFSSGEVIGYLGWEEVSEAALLRSLVVLPEYRRRGRAEKMTEIMLEMLANIGISDCYLLTTTAEKFAERLGFTRIDSATAPEAVRASRQFAELCPSSAALMHRKTQYDT